MAWHRLRHKGTGAVQVVASLDGIDAARFDVVPIAANRAPDEFQTVNDDGSMTTDTARKSDAQDEAAFRDLTPRQLFRRAVRRAKSELIDDMMAEGMIGAAMATKLRARLGSE